MHKVSHVLQFAVAMFSSLYSEIEKNFDYQNTTMASFENFTGLKLPMIAGDNNTDADNLDFWQAEFALTDPGVTTPSYQPQVPTENTSAAGKRPPARSHQLSWLTVNLFKARRALRRLPPTPCYTLWPVWFSVL